MANDVDEKDWQDLSDAIEAGQAGTQPRLALGELLSTRIQRLRDAITAIKELDGPMPAEMRDLVLADVSGALRGAVRATKREALQAVDAVFAIPDVAETEPPSVCPECGRPDSECEARPCYKPHPLRGHDAEPRLNEEIVFIRQLIDDARKHLQARMDSVNTWRDGTEESHRAAHAMAERAIGRKLPYKNAQEREQLAQIDERIGNKFCEDIVMLERIERILIGSATEPQQEHADSSRRSAAPKSD